MHPLRSTKERSRSKKSSFNLVFSFQRASNLDRIIGKGIRGLCLEKPDGFGRKRYILHERIIMKIVPMKGIRGGSVAQGRTGFGIHHLKKGETGIQSDFSTTKQAKFTCGRVIPPFESHTTQIFTQAGFVIVSRSIQAPHPTSGKQKN